MLEIKVTGAKELASKLAATPEKLKLALEQGMVRATLQLEMNIRRQLSGEVVQVRSGLLLRNVTRSVDSSRDSVIGTVGISRNVVSPSGYPYPLGLEYGTRAHVIKAKNAKVLASNKVGDWSGPVSKEGYAIFGKRVEHPGNPPFRFMRNAMEEEAPTIRNILQKAMAEALK